LQRRGCCALSQCHHLTDRTCIDDDNVHGGSGDDHVSSSHPDDCYVGAASPHHNIDDHQHDDHDDPLAP